jgi:hypothetical protein
VAIRVKLGFLEGFVVGQFLSGKRENDKHQGSNGGCCSLILLTSGIMVLLLLIPYIIGGVKSVKEFFSYLYSFSVVKYLFLPSTFDKFFNLELHPFMLGSIFFIVIAIIPSLFERVIPNSENSIVNVITIIVSIAVLLNTIVLVVRFMYLIPFGIMKFVIDLFLDEGTKLAILDFFKAILFSLEKQND